MTNPSSMPKGVTPTGNHLPFAALLPEDATGPALIYDTTAALVMAVADRGGAMKVGGDWEVPGVYVLLDRHAEDGTWDCYVGKAPAEVRARLLQHLKGKEHWARALIVRRDTTFGFNSAQVGWLEGRLYDLLSAAADTRLHNGNRPSDETLPPHERTALETVVSPIRRVLRLLGYDTDSPDDQSSDPVVKTRSSRFYGITIRQLLDDGFLTAGELLTSTNSLWPGTANVSAGGSIELHGVAHPSPSAAASALKQGQAVNGWDFWSVARPAGSTTLAEVRARWLEEHQGHTDL